MRRERYLEVVGAQLEGVLFSQKFRRRISLTFIVLLGLSAKCFLWLNARLDPVDLNTMSLQRVGKKTQVTPTELISLFFATRANSKFCSLLETAAMNDHRVAIIGWGDVDSRRFSKTFADYVCPLDEDQIVLGADAFDTLFTPSASPSEILSKFTQLGNDFVWSAESNMFPPFDELPTWVKLGYPQFDGRYAYLNFGAWIGRADAACHFFTMTANVLSGELLTSQENKTAMDCDNPPHDQAAAQCVLAAETLNISSFSYTLDYENEIFHSAWLHCDDIDASATNYTRIKSTNTKPALLHFNGDAKRCSAPYYDALVKPQADKLIATRVQLADDKNSFSLVPLQSLCQL